MKKIKAFLIYQFNSFLNYWNWYRMIRKAKFKKWASKNKHAMYFVLPFSKTTLGVIDQTQRRDYNKLALKHGFKKLSHNQLIKSAYYCTGEIITLN